MTTTRSATLELLVLAIFAESAAGCYRSSMDSSPGRSSNPDVRWSAPDSLPDVAADVSKDLRDDVHDLGDDRPADLPADRSTDLPTDRPADRPYDLGRDLRDLALDPVVDRPLDFGRDLGRDGRDLAAERTADLLLDLRPDLAVDRREAAVDLPRDRPLDEGRDLGADWPDVGADATRDLAADRVLAEVGGDTSPWFCTADEPYVLLLSDEGDGTSSLYRFYPVTLSLVRIGAVSCGQDSLNSLTASTIGPAYISNAKGELCVVDLKTFTASLTSFDASTVNNNRFGMAVLPDAVPAGQTLYIATKNTGQADTLSRIDLSTFALTTIGPVQIDLDAGTPTSAVVELTAGSGGQLYGFGIGATQSLLLTIDPATGHATQVSYVPVGATNMTYALVDWQGTIYLFFADRAVSNGATVFTFHRGDAQVTQVGSLPVPILGAGVARCQ